MTNPHSYGPDDSFFFFLTSLSEEEIPFGVSMRNVKDYTFCYSHNDHRLLSVRFICGSLQLSEVI